MIQSWDELVVVVVAMGVSHPLPPGKTMNLGHP